MCSPCRATPARTCGARRCFSSNTDPGGRSATACATSRASGGCPPPSPPRSGLDEYDVRPRMRYVEHHPAHIASAALVSPFDDAAVCAIDGFGDFVSTSWGRLEGSAVHVDRRVFFPHSLGLLYLAVTQYLGFPNYGDEFKVMGLAPYGDPHYVREIESLVNLRDGGMFELDLWYFSHWSDGVTMTWADGEPAIGRVFTPKLEQLLGKARDRRRAAPAQTRGHRRIAAGGVRARAGARAAARLRGHEEPSTMPRRRLRDEQRRQRQDPRTHRLPRRLHPAGVGRQRHRARRGVRRLACLTRPSAHVRDGAWLLGAVVRRLGDCGGAVSAGRRRFAPPAAASARWDDDAALDAWTASQIAAGRVVGWFQGRMEWGARALGNRSIVADPRRADMRDIINTRIKFRERFRPFAPSVASKRSTTSSSAPCPTRSCCRSIRSGRTNAPSCRRSRTWTVRAACRR